VFSRRPGENIRHLSDIRASEPGGVRQDYDNARFRFDWTALEGTTVVVDDSYRQAPHASRWVAWRQRCRRDRGYESV
jgi:hypothetical protein